jgi:HD-like signal output (HDOD) protein
MEQVRKDVPLLEAEKAILGFSHAELGMWLADKWNLPDTVVNTILHHHTPSLANKGLTQVAVVHLADYIATKSFLSVIEGEPQYPLDTSSFDILKISEKDFQEIELRVGNEVAFNGVFE